MSITNASIVWWVRCDQTCTLSLLLINLQSPRLVVWCIPSHSISSHSISSWRQSNTTLKSTSNPYPGSKYGTANETIIHLRDPPDESSTKSQPSSPSPETKRLHPPGPRFHSSQQALRLGMITTATDPCIRPNGSMNMNMKRRAVVRVVWIPSSSKPTSIPSKRMVMVLLQHSNPNIFRSWSVSNAKKISSFSERPCSPLMIPWIMPISYFPSVIPIRGMELSSIFIMIMLVLVLGGLVLLPMRGLWRGSLSLPLFIVVVRPVSCLVFGVLCFGICWHDSPLNWTYLL